MKCQRIYSRSVISHPGTRTRRKANFPTWCGTLDVPVESAEELCGDDHCEEKTPLRSFVDQHLNHSSCEFSSSIIDSDSNRFRKRGKFSLLGSSGTRDAIFVGWPLAWWVATWYHDFLIATCWWSTAQGFAFPSVAGRIETLWVQSPGPCQHVVVPCHRLGPGPALQVGNHPIASSSRMQSMNMLWKYMGLSENGPRHCYFSGGKWWYTIGFWGFP